MERLLGDAVQAEPASGSDGRYAWVGTWANGLRITVRSASAGVLAMKRDIALKNNFKKEVIARLPNTMEASEREAHAEKEWAAYWKTAKAASNAAMAEHIRRSILPPIDRSRTTGGSDGDEATVPRFIILQMPSEVARDAFRDPFIPAKILLGRAGFLTQVIHDPVPDATVKTHRSFVEKVYSAVCDVFRMLGVPGFGDIVFVGGKTPQSTVLAGLYAIRRNADARTRKPISVPVAGKVVDGAFWIAVGQEDAKVRWEPYPMVLRHLVVGNYDDLKPPRRSGGSGPAIAFLSAVMESLDADHEHVVLMAFAQNMRQWMRTMMNENMVFDQFDFGVRSGNAIPLFALTREHLTGLRMVRIGNELHKTPQHSLCKPGRRKPKAKTEDTGALSADMLKDMDVDDGGNESPVSGADPKDDLLVHKDEAKALRLRMMREDGAAMKALRLKNERMQSERALLRPDYVSPESDAFGRVFLVSRQRPDTMRNPTFMATQSRFYNGNDAAFARVLRYEARAVPGMDEFVISFMQEGDDGCAVADLVRNLQASHIQFDGETALPSPLHEIGLLKKVSFGAGTGQLAFPFW